MQLLQVFESQLKNNGTGGDRLGVKAVNSLKQSLATADSSAPGVADLERTLRTWYAAMCHAEITPLTRKRYIETLRALWNKAAGRGMVEKSQIFNILLLQNGSDPCDPRCFDDIVPAVSEVNVEQLRQVAIRPPKGNSDIDLMRDVFLYTLYNAGIESIDIPTLCVGKTGRECRQAQAIIDRYPSRHRKYIFPLHQGRTTNRQIALSLRNRIPAVITFFGYEEAVPFTRAAIQALWIAAARRCNLTDDDINAVLDYVPGTADPNEDGAFDDDARYMMLSTVADYLNDSTPQWYAMKLRRGIEPEHILRRLDDDPYYAAHPLQTYYPCEEITKRVDQKMKHTMRAYISEVLFFRVPFYEILPLFRLIGDMAWCYRCNNTPGSPYAVIHDIERFQKCIGQLTPDMQVEPLDKADLGIGRTVRITGGYMEGYEGEIFSLPKATDAGTSTTRIFKLKIISDKGLKITLDIPEYYIETID